jgi:putative methyltransferase (TIGR04325 family)
MSDRLHQMLDGALSVPGIRHWRIRRFDRAFSGGRYGGTCRGVYATYQQAVAAVPDTMPFGYDHDAPAGLYRDRLERVFPSDYAMMHWLDKAFDDGARRIFDLGGHVGVSYYAYQKYLRFPEALSWQLFDVPAVMTEARRLAAERDRLGALEFADRFEEVAHADVLFTSGCLQYLEQTLAEKLAPLPRRPRWVLVNLLPLHDTLAYWTVQSIGSALCPYRIQRQGDFIRSLEALGYEVCDVWENAEKRCQVAFAPEYSFDGYVGMALKLAA